jgi:hypothetical protein
MTEQTEWGPWTDHNLQGCPVDDGFILELEAKNISPPFEVRRGQVFIGRDYQVEAWNALDKECQELLKKTGLRIGILRYRIKKPKALKELLSLKVEKPDEVLVH